MTGGPSTPKGAPTEPGPALDALLRRIERNARIEIDGREMPSVTAGEILALVACIRELLRDREALLEEIEALELALSPPVSH